MNKKVLMSLVLLAIIGTSGVFAQRVGESVQLGGQTYRVESSSNGRVVLQLVPSLDGNWVFNSVGWEFAFSGSTATITYIKPNSVSGLYLDGVNKGYYKVGAQYYRNLRSTGNLTWSGQVLYLNFNTSSPNVATGTGYGDTTLTMSPDGQTLTSNTGSVFTRDPGPRQY